MVAAEVPTIGGITTVLSRTRLYNIYTTLAEALSHLQVLVS